VIGLSFWLLDVGSSSFGCMFWLPTHLKKERSKSNNFYYYSKNNR
jgi:hypothetical protein